MVLWRCRTATTSSGRHRRTPPARQGDSAPVTPTVPARRRWAARAGRTVDCFMTASSLKVASITRCCSRGRDGRINAGRPIYHASDYQVMTRTMSSGPTSRVYFSQRLRLHYVDWGNPEAPPLLLVHGGRDHCRNWDWVAAALQDEYHIIAPDLRGHGDSQWSDSGHYTAANYIYDLAQLIHQRQLTPLRIIGHSLGGNIALRYTGIYPENVSHLVAIEGLGPGPKSHAEADRKPIAERMRAWIDEQRAYAARVPRRYATIEEAHARMREANKQLTPE